MPKTRLVLSSTTTFFTGRLEATFRKAKKYGFQYLEILPYRWTKARDILALEKKYGVQIVGIHLPMWWRKSYWQLWRDSTGLFEKISSLILQFYLNDAARSTAWQILNVLSPRRPYLLFHANIVATIDNEKFDEIKKKHRVVIENVPPEKNTPRSLWDPTEIKKIAPPVLDLAHYGPFRPELPEIYRKILPDIVHVNYEHAFPFLHDLPNQKELDALRQLLLIHNPEHLVLETYPWVSAERGKKMMEKLLMDYKA